MSTELNEKDEEIDLLDLIGVLFRQKKLIIFTYVLKKN